MPGPSESPSFDLEAGMGAALAEAREAGLAGDVPVGAAVFGPSGDLVALGRNRREVDGDPTAHAEVVALRDAARRLGTWRLGGATVFATLEPCPMCAGALVNARVKRVVYACDDPKAGALKTLFSIGQDARLNHRFEIVSGVLAEESAAMLRAFFAARRSRRVP